MLKEEFIYQEYANWLLKNNDFLNNITKETKSLSFRFEPILKVLDYLYNKLIDDPNYTLEEHNIFTTGLYYVQDQVEELLILLKEVYNNDFNLFKSYEGDLFYLLTVLEFQAEIQNTDLDSEEEKVLEIDQEIFDQITNKNKIDNKIKSEFDLLSLKIIERHKIDYYSISDIFFDIKEDLGIDD